MVRLLLLLSIVLLGCSSQPQPPVVAQGLPCTLDSNQLRPELRAFIQAYIDESANPSGSLFLVSGAETDSGMLYRVSELRGSGEGWNAMHFSPLYTTLLRGQRVWFDGGLGRYAREVDSAFFYAQLPPHWGAPESEYNDLFCRGGWTMLWHFRGHRTIRKGVSDHFAPYVAEAQVRFIPPAAQQPAR